MSLTMPTRSAVEEARKNLLTLIPDGHHIATVVAIREGRSKEDFIYYLPEWSVEIEGRPSVTDYISLENPKTVAFSQLKLDEMALAMLKLQPGETYDIEDFIYKSASITIKNKKDKDGYLKPRIVNIVKVTDNPLNEEKKNDEKKREPLKMPESTDFIDNFNDEIPF